MATADSKTFLITGVSSGLGRAFAEGALDGRPPGDRHGAAGRAMPRPLPRSRRVAPTRWCST